MPHHCDFSEFDKIYEIEIDVIGWVSPLNIEYSYVMDFEDTKLYWRVKGTTHTFTIPVTELNKISKGNITQHLQQALTVFRDDVVKWTVEGLKEKWMREYSYMYRNFIKF
jgi:hypothetical protein